jgi:c-di-GMP-binding flagellar brake protein YcgR
MAEHKLVNGVVINLTAEEIVQRETEAAAWAAGAFNRALEQVRRRRNALISATDYLALSDNTLSDDMKNYRQALRDITNGITTVEQINSISWPTKP